MNIDACRIVNRSCGRHRRLQRRWFAQRQRRGTLPATVFHGGVAERLIAPVLKTGRPKGLVSSNLTPSASLVVRREMVYLGCFQKPTNNDQGADDSEDRRANNVGQIMRCDIHS